MEKKNTNASSGNMFKIHENPSVDSKVKRGEDGYTEIIP
jgi:hypothetical protein